MPKVTRAAPRVAHLRRLGAAIRVGPNRILPGRIEVGWLDHQRFHVEAVARFHIHEFDLAEFVLRQRFNFILVNDPHKFAARVIQADLSRRVDVAPCIDEVRSARAERSAMIPFSLSQPREA